MLGLNRLSLLIPESQQKLTYQLNIERKKQGMKKALDKIRLVLSWNLYLGREIRLTNCSVSNMDLDLFCSSLEYQLINLIVNVPAGGRQVTETDSLRLG